MSRHRRRRGQALLVRRADRPVLQASKHIAEPERHPARGRVPFDVTSKDFHLAVSNAATLATRQGTISYTDLPTPWRINSFIEHGYRFTYSTASAALSPFMLSNELVNIWTHLIPIALVLAQPLYFNPLLATFRDDGLGRTSDALIAGTYYVAATGSFICSVFWHTFRCCAHVRVMSGCLAMDVMAISLVLTAFNIVTVHTAFYTEPLIRQLYLLSCVLWCFAGLVLPWTSLFGPRELATIIVPLPRWWRLSRRWGAVIFFCGLGLQGTILPALHLAMKTGTDAAAGLLAHTFPPVLPIFIGAFLFAGKVPERFWPGKFDYFGSSHNIWHVATAIAALNGSRAMREMFHFAWQRAREQGIEY